VLRERSAEEQIAIIDRTERVTSDKLQIAFATGKAFQAFEDVYLTTL
jgi:hypothetical protein